MSHPSMPLPDERAFGAVFERAADGILLAADDGRYVRANPAAEALTGYSEAELCAMSIFDLTPMPDREAGQSMWREFTHGGELSGDYALVRKDGSIIEVEFRAVAGIMPGIHLSIVRDATARKHDERQLRRTARLQSVTAALSAASDTASVARVILEGGLATLEAQAGHVVAVVDGGRSFELVSAIGVGDREEQWANAYRDRGFPPQRVNGRYRFSLDVPTMLTDVFHEGASLRLVQLADHEHLNQLLGDLGPTMVCLPLVVSGSLVGGLYLYWQTQRGLHDNERALAATLAGLCAQALARAALLNTERETRARAEISERTVLDYQERLQRMTFDHTVREERERRRIASALHDGVTQYLALAKITLGPVRPRLEGDARAAMDSALRHVDEAIAETRSLCFELSPPILYDLGLAAALGWLGARLERDVGLAVEIIEDEKPSIDDTTASIVFRAGRELLLNVVKHGACMSAVVWLGQHADQLELVVEDSGAGFDPAHAEQVGFGLMNIREEIGRLGGVVSVTSAPHQGTRVCIRVPGKPR